VGKEIDLKKIVSVFIGAEYIISPLGNGAEENYLKLKENVSGICLFKNAGFKKEDIYLSKITGMESSTKFETLVRKCLEEIRGKVSTEIFSSSRTIVILSTTKGNLESELTGTIVNTVKDLQNNFHFKNIPIVISNACASGVIAINTGADLIRAGLYDHAIVIGCDVISDFILFGFQSLFAISDEPCAPYDKDRKGITLGEGAAAVVLSDEKMIFAEQPMEYINGSSSNDANHISGPSRTGEGLYRTVKKTISLSNVHENEIDFISAHGTGTLYNDDMESVALHRLNLDEVPMNSLKGYFGHTLGASGVIETACCIQSMRKNLLVKNQGLKTPGTVEELNVISENKSKEINVILKTASGFGGCNASMLIRKI
jgi:3-oxoacyl-[acyl-carrier-protein] synthase-1